jgi:hypothetical protein
MVYEGAPGGLPSTHEETIMRHTAARTILTVLAGVTVAAVSNGCGLPKSSYTTEKAPVLKVYSTADGPHRFIAYVVDRHGTQIVVSDPLGHSNHKVGDTITYMDQKISVGKGTDALSFTLLDIP